MADEGPQCRRCCSCPHGMQVIIAGVMSIFALIFSFVVMGSCHYADQERGRGVGLFGYEMEYGVCYNYNYIYSEYKEWGLIDPSWRAARVFSVLASCIGFVAFVVTWCGACVAFRRRLFVSLSFAYAFCSTFSFLTMLFFASSICEGGKCVFGSGAGFAIANGLLYAGCAISSWLTPEAKEGVGVRTLEIPTIPTASVPTASVAAGHTAVVPGTVTTTQTVRPDGTKITETITTMADGSQVVEETTETPV